MPNIIDFLCNCSVNLFEYCYCYENFTFENLYWFHLQQYKKIYMMWIGWIGDHLASASQLGNSLYGRGSGYCYENYSFNYIRNWIFLTSPLRLLNQFAREWWKLINHCCPLFSIGFFRLQWMQANILIRI